MSDEKKPIGSIDEISQQAVNLMTQVNNLLVRANDKSVKYLGCDIPEVEPGLPTAFADAGLIGELGTSLILIQARLEMVENFIDKI